jgi:hypothetical protein
MLDPAVMREALRMFCDRRDSDFIAFPGNESEARTKWGQAFLSYVQTIAPTLSTALVVQTFHDTLRLARSFGSMPATTDFAAAWRAAMLSTGTPWDEPLFTARETQLRTTMRGLLPSTTHDAFTRLDAIADAFHAATNMLTSGGGATTHG